ncbi:hypothetical protein V6259_12780 [Marinomonas sp. TI.3.20]|uniref:hypothetical protein n=1 Tax=Marinomonas sp. TI.3.20 TaxID=3121296 RepID=UPI00311F99AA
MNWIQINNAVSIKEARTYIKSTFSQGEIIKTSDRPSSIWIYFVSQSGEHTITLFSLKRTSSIWYFHETPESEIKDNFSCPISLIKAANRAKPKAKLNANLWRNKMLEIDDTKKNHKKNITSLKKDSIIKLHGIIYKLKEKKDYVSSNSFFFRSRMERQGWAAHDVRNTIPLFIPLSHLEHAEIVSL